MKRIDAHQHFWKYDPVRDAWITDEMSVLKKDYLPANLFPDLLGNQMDGCVLVQSDQSKQHNEFLLEQAAQFDFITGIVGWVDLQADNIEEELAAYLPFKKMKGFRHILQSEADRALMLKPAFRRGIAALEKFNFTYDILVYSDQLKYAAELAAAFPNQAFVLDHLGKPGIKEKQITEWEKDIKALAKLENLYCKISGMVTEAEWKTWSATDFRPYLDIAVNTFGTRRLMFGSDWPVCLLAASYDEVVKIVQDYFSSFSKDEQELIFGGNAIKFYNLN